MAEAGAQRILAPAKALLLGTGACIAYAWVHLLATSLFPLVADDWLFDLAARMRLPWSCAAAGLWRTDTSMLLLSEHWIPSGGLLPFVLAGLALVLHSLVYAGTLGSYMAWGRPPYVRDLARELGLVRLGLHLWAKSAWQVGWVLPVMGLVWCTWLRWFQMDLPARAFAGSSLDLRAHSWLAALGALTLAYSFACGAVLRAFVGRAIHPEQRRCWKCGYYLRGLDSQRCPECGRQRQGRRDLRLRLGASDRPLWIGARWTLAAMCFLVMLMLPLLGPLAGLVVRDCPLLHPFAALVPAVARAPAIAEAIHAGVPYSVNSPVGSGEIVFTVTTDGSWVYESTWRSVGVATAAVPSEVRHAGSLFLARLGQTVTIGPWTLPCTPVTRSRAWLHADRPGLTIARELDQARR